MDILRVRLFSYAALAIAVTIAAPVAAAQPQREPSAADKDTARKLLDVGDAAMAKKDYAEALKAYEGAHAIMNVPVTGWSVAQAEKELGHYLEARDTALAVTRMPKGPAESPEFIEARKEAEELAAKLDGMIPSIQVQPSGLPPDIDIEVTIDGSSIPSAAATLPRRVNPGPHTIVVKAAGFVDATQTVTAQEGAQTIAVPIEMKKVGEGKGPELPPPDKGDHKPPEGGGKKISLLLPIGGAITAVGLGVGIGTGVAALDTCTTKGCALGWASDVGFIVAAGGAAVTVAGIVLTVSSHDPPPAAQDPKQAPKATTLTLVPLIGPGYAGLRGEF